MRALLMGSAVSLLIFTSDPAHADDRDGYMGHLHWRCEEGDHQACRLVHLHRECEDGDRGACETQHLYRECDEGNPVACERIRFQSLLQPWVKPW